MSLNDFFTQNFNTQRDQWEKSLRTELKIDDVVPKTTKNSPEGSWPTLSLEAKSVHQLHPLEKWKKASQSYVKLPTDLKDDLENGVRVFFFEKDFMTNEQWKKISAELASHKDAKDIVVVLLGDKNIPTTHASFKLIDESKMATGRFVAAQGGNTIQELALMTLSMIDRLGENEIHIGVFLDSQFFKNIAKIRAARLLAQKVLETAGMNKKVFVTGLTSYRDWTLYERYSNMLRDNASVASGYIGACDYVQSSGYQTLFELETNETSVEHEERSHRMARNIASILSLESMLGVVEDASSGSYHLESLTEEFAEGAWALMQKLAVMSDVNEFLAKEAALVREDRQKKFNTRKYVLAGINDFADVKDSLSLKETPKARFFRTARQFEELRLRMESAKKPEVYVAIYGDYSALHARINFAKNYFELLGLKVVEAGHGVKDKAQLQKEISARNEDFLVLVASDEHYAEVADMQINAKEKYIAGKTEMKGMTNIFAGQDVLQVLGGIVERWGKK
jgi:hypothetical protein